MPWRDGGTPVSRQPQKDDCKRVVPFKRTECCSHWRVTWRAYRARQKVMKALRKALIEAFKD
jgi:hypothetical protein